MNLSNANPLKPTHVTFCLMTLALTLSGPLAVAVQAQQIVLRDLTLIKNVNVETQDVNGLNLASGQQITWDRILQGSIGTDQKAFDQNVKQIGEPLFRLRNRLSNGSHHQLQPMVDDLLKIAGDQPGLTNYIATTGLFFDKLSSNRRAAALVPMLTVLQFRSTYPKLAELDAQLGLHISDDGFCLDLLPVWFDKQQTESTWRQLEKDEVTKRSDLIAVNKIYLSSLASFTGRQWQTDLTNDNWQALLSAQSAWFNNKPAEVIERLDNSAANLQPFQQAIAVYYRGLAMRALQQRNTDLAEDQWKLCLLQIPANYPDKFPELSAAAIFHVLGEPEQRSREYDSLDQVMRSRYADTYYGRRYQQLGN